MLRFSEGENVSLSFAVFGYGFAMAVISYCLLCVSVNPRQDLLIATGVELFVFLFSLVFSLRQTRSRQGKLEKVVLSGLVEKWRFIALSWHYLKKTANLLALTLLFLLALDLSAMTCARLGFYSASGVLYRLSPVTYCSAIHPGFSSEMLAGASIEAGNFKQAHELFAMLKKLRLELYGEKCELHAAILADEAELALKEKHPELAESFYRQGLTLSKAVLKNRGSGRILTRYADFLRDQGRYEEADKYYLEALDMRQKQFGVHSEKVMETLQAYRHLVRLAGGKVKLGTDLAEINKRIAYEEALRGKSQSKLAPFVNAFLCVFVLVCGFIGSRMLFGAKGLATNFLLQSLLRRYNLSPLSLSDKDRQRLVALLKLTEQEELAQKVAMSGGPQAKELS
jgi:tetratricopeptide (TPR) repeat protein